MKKLDLKCQPSTLETMGVRKRYLKTLDFVNSIPNSGNVLSIGGESVVDVKIAQEAALKHYYTEGDLDHPGWKVAGEHPGRFDNVFIFEVIEHLVNPLLMLEELKRYIDRDTQIFISYPKSFLEKYMSPKHFHEMDVDRFEYMIDKAGYKIETATSITTYFDKWYYPITGIRPLLKTITFDWYFKHHVRHFFLVKLI